MAKPAAPTTPKPSPTPTPALDPARVTKLAKILRAADRRVVDDDLVALAADPDDKVRAKAALALGQIGETGHRATWDALAADKAASVRAAAAFGMGQVAEPASRASLETLSADAEASVRAAAVEALGRLRDDLSLPRVAALLDDPDAGVRRATSRAAGEFAHPASLLPGLLRDLAAEDSRVRPAAAYALARMTSAPFVPASSGSPVGHLVDDDLHKARAALAARVSDPVAEVRMQVARGLTAPQNASEAAVVGSLTGDKDPRVRVNAVKSLGFPTTPVRPYLDRALVDGDPGVMRTALEAVGKICSAPALGLLQDNALRYEGSWLREAYVTSLAQCDPAQAPDIVEGLLANPDPVMRAAAAPLITGHKEARAVRAGLALGSDPEPRVQVVGIPYVADQDGPIERLLASKLKSPDPVVRSAVAEAIGGRLQTPRAGGESREDLLRLLSGQWQAAGSDPIPDTKLAILDAAAKAGKDPAAVALLETGLKDPEVVVRRRAAERLQTATGADRRSEIGPAADRPLADYEEIVRFAALPHAAVVTMQREGSLPGRFSVRLDGDAAPLAAWNFAQLAGKRFFDGRIVHRVVPNFVVQDGDPRGDGFGGPGYSIRDEYNPLPYEAGTLGMASDGKDTAGSQWFVTLSMQPHLDGRYTSFGEVVQGLREIVGQIRPGDTVVSIRVYEGNGTEPLPKE